MDFHCVEECSKCCVERNYYPSVEFGKIGVLILPEEKEKIEKLAKKLGIDVTILPRVGVSGSSQDKNTIHQPDKKENGPERIVAYQLMGKESNGNTCPFLDTESSERSPHGGYKCKIYQDRPLACKAYPLIDSNRIVTLDSSCEYCKKHHKTSFGQHDLGNLNCEKEALSGIKKQVKTYTGSSVWRFATGIADESDLQYVKIGWIRES